MQDKKYRVLFKSKSRQFRQFLQVQVTRDKDQFFKAFSQDSTMKISKNSIYGKEISRNVRTKKNIQEPEKKKIIIQVCITQYFQSSFCRTTYIYYKLDKFTDLI